MNNKYKTKKQLIEEIENLQSELAQSQKAGAIQEIPQEKLPREFGIQDHILFEVSPHGILLEDINGFIVDANPAYCIAMGYKRNELIGKQVHILAHPDVIHRVDDFIAQLSQGNTLNHVAKSIRKDGSVCYMRLNEKSIVLSDGRNGILCLAENISKQLEFENALKESEEKYRSIFQYSPLGILHFDHKGIITNCNEKFVEIIGSSKDVLIGLDMLNQLNDAKLVNTIKAALDTGYAYYDDEYQSITAEKKTPVRAYFNAIYSAHKKIIGGVGIIEDVSEQVKAKNKLVESEERYRRLVELSPEAIVVHCDGKFIFANNSAMKLIGVKNKNDLIGKPVLDIVHPDYKEFAIKRIRNMLENGKDSPLAEEKFICFDGRVIDVEVKAIPIRFRGKPAVQVVTRDITERKLSELSIGKKNQELENILETARHLTESLDIKDVLNKIATGAMKILNAASFCVFLLEPDKKTLKPVVAIDPDYEEEILSTHIKVDNSFTGQSVKAKCGLIFNETGKDSIGYQIPGTPEETEERLIAVPFIVDDNVLGAICISRIGDLFTNQELALAETYATYASAALKNAKMYNDLQNEVEERKNAQNILYDLNIQYESFIQNSMVGIWKLEFDKPIPTTLSSTEIAKKIINTGIFTECNDAFAHMYGFASNKEIIGRKNKIFSVNIQDSLNRLKQFVKNNFKTEIVDNEELDKNGKIHHFRNSYFGITDKKILRWVWGIQIDITEQKRLESQLFQSQKMEAIGTLAGGVAHDFNNILTVINGHAEIGLMKMESKNPFHKELISILKAGKKAENLVRQLLAFSRKQLYQPKTIDLNVTIKDIDKMLRRVIGEDINMEKVFSPDRLNIKADPGQIEQIFMNLVVNARDAINARTEKAAEKKITIETGKICFDEKDNIENPELPIGTNVYFSISDSGIGIQDDIKEKIFEPFFTTKDKSQGTGLGLATVYGIVKQNNGYIYVYSEINQGSTVKVYWPADEDNQTVEKNEVEISKALPGSETIFLVEDDKSVRNFTSVALNNLGYNIYVASNGKKALKILKNNKTKTKIDLLITDMIMPKMNGKELAEKFHHYFPNTPVLFISGYTYNHIDHSGILEKKLNFLQKPFSVWELTEKVRKILDKK